MSTEVLATLPNSIDAHLLKSKLENEGIESFLMNENFSSWFPIYYNILGGGVQVVVKRGDLVRAREIAKLDSGKVTCPACGSLNIELAYERPQRKAALLFIGLLLAGLIGNLMCDYTCKDCREEFKR